MKVYVKKEAMKVFYYLLLADGDASDAEKELFDQIGKEVDETGFQSYRDEVIEECGNLANDEDEERLERIEKAIDHALEVQTNSLEEGIPPRLLLWDLMILAFANYQYDESEERIIRHITDVLSIDESLYYEMKHTAETSVILERELSWMEQQDRPYREIRPIVDELEKRIAGLRVSAENLIADEVITPDPEEKPNVVLDTIEVVKEKTGTAFNVAKETVETGITKGIEGIKVGFGFLAGKAQELFTKPEKKEE